MINKPLIVFQGPVRSRSGYGDHTRDLISSLIDMDKYDIKIAATRWGDCPETGLQGNPNKAKFEQLIMTDNRLPKQPDIYINCSIPNEFQPIGKYNIGITAGIETTIAPGEWIEGCNRMNLILGSSKHTIDVLRNSKWEKRNKQTN